MMSNDANDHVSIVRIIHLYNVYQKMFAMQLMWIIEVR